MVRVTDGPAVGAGPARPGPECVPSVGPLLASEPQRERPQDGGRERGAGCGSGAGSPEGASPRGRPRGPQRPGLEGHGGLGPAWSRAPQDPPPGEEAAPSGLWRVRKGSVTRRGTGAGEGSGGAGPWGTHAAPCAPGRLPLRPAATHRGSLRRPGPRGLPGAPAGAGQTLRLDRPVARPGLALPPSQRPRPWDPPAPAAPARLARSARCRSAGPAPPVRGARRVGPRGRRLRPGPARRPLPRPGGRLGPDPGRGCPVRTVAAKPRKTGPAPPPPRLPPRGPAPVPGSAPPLRAGHAHPAVSVARLPPSGRAGSDRLCCVCGAPGGHRPPRPLHPHLGGEGQFLGLGGGGGAGKTRPVRGGRMDPGAGGTLGVSAGWGQGSCWG